MVRKSSVVLREASLRGRLQVDIWRRTSPSVSGPEYGLQLLKLTGELQRQDCWGAVSLALALSFIE